MPLGCHGLLVYWLPFFLYGVLGEPVIQGYDVVEYFHLQDRGLQYSVGKHGVPKYACRLKTSDKSGTAEAHLGVYEFWFSSLYNMKKFQLDPWKYAPRFGGFCSWSVATGTGTRVPSDRERAEVPSRPKDSWVIHNGSVYLSLDPRIRDAWLADAEERTRIAKNRWAEWWGAQNAGLFNLACFSSKCREHPQSACIPNISGRGVATPEGEWTDSGFTPFFSLTSQSSSMADGQMIQNYGSLQIRASGTANSEHDEYRGFAGSEAAHPCQDGAVLSENIETASSVQNDGKKVHARSPQRGQERLTPDVTSYSHLLGEQSSRSDGFRPVLLGYDTVEYTKLKKGDVGVIGQPRHVCHLATYDKSKSASDPGLIGVYEFWFATEENMAAFGRDPWKYAPKWGGFCSWGVSHELPPHWPWAADHMGPPVQPWNAWTVHEGALYMNYWPSVARQFFSNAKENIELAKARWESWYGVPEAGPFNTQCLTAACLDKPQEVPSPCPPDGRCTGVIPEVRCFTRNGSALKASFSQAGNTLESMVVELQNDSINNGVGQNSAWLAFTSFCAALALMLLALL